MRTTLFFTLFLWLSATFAASPAPVTAEKEMVVTAQHYATKVGLDVLKQGGNAIDAAVAVGYALAVTHPCCGNLGGGGFMLVRLNDGSTHFLNFREKAPLAATPEKFAKIKLTQGHLKGFSENAYLSVGIPGTVLGLNTALQQFGTIPLKDLMTPAIKLAKEGYVLKPDDARILSYGVEAFRNTDNASKIFLNKGKAYQTGETFKQPELANSLQLIANHGSDVFYHGELAKAISKHSQENMGLITEKDFAEYTITQDKPIQCHYRGYDIITSAPPAGGGITLCQILHIVENFPLADYGYHSAKSTHVMVEAMRYAFADRNTYLADPDFVNNPIEKLNSKIYAKEIAKKIQLNQAGDSKKINKVAPLKEGETTTAYSIIDRYGNAVAVTYTLNNYFGARIVAGDTGILLNNELDDFTLRPGKPNAFGLVQGKVNLIAPGKRPLSSIGHTIIMKDNQLFMVLATPGGSTIPTQLANVITNVIDFGMNIQEAIDAPRFHMQSYPDVIYMEPYTFSADTIEKLMQMGHTLQASSPYGSKRWGAVMGILVDPKNGKLTSGLDSRRPAGLAAGR